MADTTDSELAAPSGAAAAPVYTQEDVLLLNVVADLVEQSISGGTTLGRQMRGLADRMTNELWERSIND